ncbi:MAG: hypothetical protein WCO65_02015 [bacterium]
METNCIQCKKPFFKKRAEQKFCSVTCANRKNLNNKNKFIPLKKPNESLAELFGILLGDGSVEKYYTRIYLNVISDKEYAKNVLKIISKALPSIQPTLVERHSRGTVEIQISSKDVCDYLRSLGFNSKQRNIPKWIFDKSAYQRACVRGLIDTDGCIVREIHTIKDKKYIYNRVNFVTTSFLLSKSVFRILKSNNLNPTTRRNGKSVQVENNEKICQYFKVIGTSNPKHLRRWKIKMEVSDSGLFQRT